MEEGKIEVACCAPFSCLLILLLLLFNRHCHFYYYDYNWIEWVGRSVGGGGGNPHHTNKRPDKTTRDAFVMSHLLLLLILYASRRVYYYIVTRALIFARPLSSLPACHLLLLHCGLCLIRPSVRPSVPINDNAVVVFCLILWWWRNEWTILIHP